MYSKRVRLYYFCQTFIVSGSLRSYGMVGEVKEVMGSLRKLKDKCLHTMPALRPLLFQRRGRGGLYYS